MDDYTYQTHEVEDGTHILVFKNGEFERKVFVPFSESRPTAYVWVIDNRFRTLFQSNSFQALKWLTKDPDKDRAKQIGIGKDFQLISVEEFIALYG